MSEEDFIAAERQAEQQRAAREREIIERAGDRLVREIDQALEVPSIELGSEMGTGPSSDPRRLDEQMLELKRAQLDRGLRLVKLTKETPAREQPAPARHDSPERREAIQRHLEAMGVDPHLRAIRELIERGQAEPPAKAVEVPPNLTSRGTPQGGRDPKLRGTEQTRDERGKEGR